MKSSSATIRAGIIGWPISHSLSPRLHGFWLKQLGINGCYEAFAVSPENLARELQRFQSEGLVGLNVTLPHKESVLGLADHADDHASRIGAANTLMFRHGRMEVSNTDGFGFIQSLRDGAPDHDLTRPALVIGAGGAARAIVSALVDIGTRNVRVVNRTASRTTALCRSAGPVAVPIAWQTRTEALDGVGLLVNTTSLGMTGQPSLDLDLHGLPQDAVVHDIVYKPLETPLLAVARARGNRTVDGLGMLLHQARPGFEAWFGVAPSVSTILRDHMLAALGP